MLILGWVVIKLKCLRLPCLWLVELKCFWLSLGLGLLLELPRYLIIVGELTTDLGLCVQVREADVVDSKFKIIAVLHDHEVVIAYPKSVLKNCLEDLTLHYALAITKDPSATRKLRAEHLNGQLTTVKLHTPLEVLLGFLHKAADVILFHRNGLNHLY